MKKRIMVVDDSRLVGLHFGVLLNGILAAAAVGRNFVIRAL